MKDLTKLTDNEILSLIYTQHTDIQKKKLALEALVAEARKRKLRWESVYGS
jgi:hypothetical protein